eukprot:6654491-Pyramimonas_sp.AAC.1
MEACVAIPFIRAHATTSFEIEGREGNLRGCLEVKCSVPWASRIGEATCIVTQSRSRLPADKGEGTEQAS